MESAPGQHHHLCDQCAFRIVPIGTVRPCLECSRQTAALQPASLTQRLQCITYSKTARERISRCSYSGEGPARLLSALTPRQPTLMAVLDGGRSSRESTQSDPFELGHHPIEPLAGEPAPA